MGDGGVVLASSCHYDKRKAQIININKKPIVPIVQLFSFKFQVDKLFQFESNTDVCHAPVLTSEPV